MTITHQAHNPADKKLYIASMGMVTPVGGNVAMTAAMIAADMSAYESSELVNAAGEKITMALVPGDVLDACKADIDNGDCFNIRHDRVTRLAILALQQACGVSTTEPTTTEPTTKKPANTEQAVPLILAMPDVQTYNKDYGSFVDNLANNLKPWINPAMSRSLYSGRASGIEAIDFAFQYLYGDKYPYLLVGGSDSYQDASRLTSLDKANRLLSIGASDAFAPGEAACFLRLTPHLSLAHKHNGHVIALSCPGISEEAGHLNSDAPYLGEGLDQAFKKALVHQAKNSIHSIYSSMNGEHYWAKEYGVAYLRNSNKFKDPVNVEHPADCYGDIGSATATTLIALAAEHLLSNKNADAHLVYSASDSAKRGAIVVEKIKTHT